MSFSESSALIQTPEFQEKVKIAAVTAAIAIVGEAKGTYSTIHTGKRQALAAAILGGSVNWSIWFYSVASNQAITAASLDSDIQYTVNANWDKMAGVTTLDAVADVQ